VSYDGIHLSTEEFVGVVVFLLILAAIDLYRNDISW